jgi:CAAX amino terminal protease family.
MENKKTYPAVKAAAAVVLSAVSVSAAWFIAQSVTKLLSPVLSGFAPAAGGFLYMWCALTCVFLIGCKTDVSTEQSCLIPIRWNAGWLCAACIVPGAALAGFLTTGHVTAVWTPYAVSSTVFLTGIGAAAAEEGVYRGIMKTAVERRWGANAGIIVPAVIQAAVLIMLQRKGTAYSYAAVCFCLAQGVLLSAVVDRSRSVWNAAAVHAVWNILFAGTVLRFTDDTQALLWSAAVFAAAACIVPRSREQQATVKPFL